MNTAPVSAQTVVAAPTFSVRHGFFTSSFQLTLASATSGAQIRYTTNFATPTPSSGTLYSGPITINSTTVVRAVAYTSSSNKSITVAQTYIFPANVKTQPATPGGSWPSLFAAADSNGGPYLADYEMDPQITTHANYASGFEASLKTIPTLSLVTDQPNLWDSTTGIYNHPAEKGTDWERAASLEWIDPSGVTLGFTENMGIRIHGQASRRPYAQPKKTLRGYFNITYGNTKLDFKLFDDNDASAKFDHILMRGGGNRSWPFYDIRHRPDSDYVNDEFARRAYLEMGGLTPHGTYAHFYLNGLYWGLYNITERPNDRFLRDYLGGTESEYDLIFADEENNYAITADAGTTSAYNELLSLVNVSTISNSTYDAVRQRLDVVNLADYMILLHYIANTDWPTHNWYAYRKLTGSDNRFRMMVWDSDTALRTLTENTTTRDAVGSPARIFLKLMTNAEFRQLVADRFYKHLVNSSGQLTDSRCASRYTSLVTIIDQAVIPESARWGDYVRDVYPLLNSSQASGALPAYLHSRDLPDSFTDPANAVADADQKNWVDVRDYKLSTYCPQRSGIVTNQYVANGWYQTTLKPPSFAQEGGAVSTGFVLAIANSPNSNTGDIYYSTNGVDPRTVGGAVAAGAINGGDAANVTINQVTTVLARVLNGSQWSPLHEATFYPPQPFNNLVINELHYNPTATAPANPDDFEFIELINNGGTGLRLDNVKFTRGFTFKFPLNTTINPGQYIVLAANSVSYQARYGSAPYGQMRGNLSNGGETIELSDAVGNVIDSVSYLDVSPWPTTPDGSGPSLALCNPGQDNAQASNWRASNQNNGTPGAANGLSCGGTVNQPPTVSLTAPANNAIFTQGAAVSINATASDADGSIAQVVFRDNGTPIATCSDTTSPYACTFTPGVGAHALTAVASDNLGATGTSTAVNITVNSPTNLPPSVSISAPANNDTFTEGTLVTINATASDSDGSVTQVVFQDNGNPIAGCSDTTLPYACTFTPAVGSHALTAIASDNLAAQTTSTPAVNINITPIGGGSGAFIEQNGQVVMEAENFANKVARSNHDWQNVTTPTGAVGSAMNSLPNSGTSIGTLIESTSPQMNYEVQFAQTGSYNVWVRAFGASGSDDSVHIGIGGLVKSTINTGSGSWQWKKASSTLNVTTPGLQLFNLWMREDNTVVDRILLTTASTTPSGNGPAESPRGSTGNQAPTVSITAPANNSSVNQGAQVTINANASDSDGSITQVVFYDNGTPIAGCSDTTAPYACTFTPAVGPHALTAIASDNGGASNTSAGVNLTVNSTSNTAPTAALTAPANGSSWPVNTPVNLTANASDSDGTITQVAFTVNGAGVCLDTLAPYACSWTFTSAGSYQLTAIATDNGGASSTSTVINVTISGGGSGAFLEQNGQVVIEAESFATKIDRSAHAWITSSSPSGFGGSAAMLASPNNGANLQTNVPTTSPEMQYLVQFSTAGTYYIWVRAWAANGSDDSLHSGLNGVLNLSISTASGTNWLWTKKTFGTVAAGTRTVNLWMREDGILIDRMILTTNGSFTPSGIGPAESPRATVIVAAEEMPSDPPALSMMEDSEDAIMQPGAPLVWINSPEGDLNVPSGSVVTFNALASQIGNQETQVLFYANDQLIEGCDVSSAPYQCTWTPPIGTHVVTAVAFGNETSATSAPINVMVEAEKPDAGTLLEKFYLPLITQQ